MNIMLFLLSFISVTASQVSIDVIEADADTSETSVMRRLLDITVQNTVDISLPMSTEEFHDEKQQAFRKATTRNSNTEVRRIQEFYSCFFASMTKMGS